MCAKFRGSRAIVGLVGLVPSWLNGYFLGPNGYFVCPKFFLVSISWVHFFSCSWFRDSKILSCWLHEQEWQKQKYKNTLVFICSNCIFRHLFSSVLGNFQRYLLQLLGLLFYNYSSEKTLPVSVISCQFDIQKCQGSGALGTPKTPSS